MEIKLLINNSSDAKKASQVLLKLEKNLRELESLQVSTGTGKKTKTKQKTGKQSKTKGKDEVPDAVKKTAEAIEKIANKLSEL